METQVERQFKKITISQEYAEQVIEAAKQLLQEFREGKNQDRVILYSRKAKLEAAMRETEDNRFIHHILSDEAFKRIYPRYEQELVSINNQINQLEGDHSHTIETVQRLLNLAENIGEMYKEADSTLKRFYLGLFWEEFYVKEGKIVKSRLNKAVKPLLASGSVRVSHSGLRNPSINLTDLFFPIFKVFMSAVIVEQARAELEQIKRLTSSTYEQSSNLTYGCKSGE